LYVCSINVKINKKSGSVPTKIKKKKKGNSHNDCVRLLAAAGWGAKSKGCNKV
jgi:hypothetical protein